MRGYRSIRFAIAAAVVVVSFVWGSGAPETAREPAWYAGMVESRASTARQYSFDATIHLARKIGEGQREPVATFKVKVAVAPENRFLFWLGDKSDLRYVIASDGSHTWAYVPSENRYAEYEAIVSRLRADPARAFLAPLSKDDVDPLLWSSFVMPILSRLSPGSASMVDVRWWPGSSESGDGRETPVMTVLSGKPEDPQHRLTELVFDPDTLDVSHLDWSSSVLRDDQPEFALMAAEFSTFEVDRMIPASHFVFLPGDAQRADTLPLPGIDGSWIEGRAAPEFSVQLSGGRSAGKTDLRGRAAVIVFSGRNCGPCEKQSKVVGELQGLVKERGLAILDAGAESLEAHWAFRVHLLPTLVVMDKQGRVVRYLPGLRPLSEIRSAVEQAAAL